MKREILYERITTFPGYETPVQLYRAYLIISIFFYFFEKILHDNLMNLVIALGVFILLIDGLLKIMSRKVLLKRI